MNDRLEVIFDNAAELAANDKEAFTLLRRNGLGASDSSIVLGVNIWTTLDELIEQKRSKEITKEEMEIGEKPQVRMGADLEPIILQKFCKWSGLECTKPAEQFRIKEYPYLTVNFDALTVDNIPVEIKCVSMYAEKHWKKNACMEKIDSPVRIPTSRELNIVKRVNTISAEYGIPPYYFTQCQQQMLGIGADHCYLAAMFVKDWTLRVWYIQADKPTQDAIIHIGKTVWDCVKM